MATFCNLAIEDFLQLPTLASSDNICKTPNCEYGAIGQHPRRPVQQQAQAPGVSIELYSLPFISYALRTWSMYVCMYVCMYVYVCMY